MILFYQNLIKAPSDKCLVKEGQFGRVFSYKFMTLDYWGGANEDVLWARNDDDLFKKMFSDFNS